MDLETNKQLTPAVAGEPKRPRKRSRYLSPPYTDADDAPAGEVCAADVLSALRAAALLGLDSQQGLNTAQALRFLALYRNSSSSAHTLSADEDAPAAGVGVGRKPLLNLSTPAMPTPAPGSTKKKKKKQNPQQTPAPAANASADPAVNAPITNAKRKRKHKKMMNNTGHQQGQHFGNPVALVLDFAEATPLPSTDDLLSTFRKFGFLIHSETAILQDDRSARVVFATRAEAEAAYRCAQTLGAPFATPRLQDLPPITLNAPPPLPKLPLKDVRKNLEKMISSLTCRSSSFEAGADDAPQGAKPAVGNLVGEMQGLLAKVDKMLQGASSTGHHD